MIKILRFSHALNIKYKLLLQNVTEKHFPELHSAVQRLARLLDVPAEREH